MLGRVFRAVFLPSVFIRWIARTIPKKAIYGTVDSIACRSRIDCMSPATNEPDELIDQVLEDERAAALQEFRERQEKLADV